MQHIVAVLLLLARLGDIGSTYFVTPDLKLEANPLVRRFGWKFAWTTLVICLVPYVHVGAGFALTVASLLVTASNLSRSWVARAMGGDEYHAVMRAAASKSALGVAVASQLASTFVLAAAGVLLLLSDFVDYVMGEEFVLWFGIGMIAYAIAIAFHSTLFTVRLFRSVRAQPATPSE